MTAPSLSTHVHSVALLYIACTAAPTIFCGICWHSCRIWFYSCCTVAGIGLYTLDVRYLSPKPKITGCEIRALGKTLHCIEMAYNLSWKILFQENSGLAICLVWCTILYEMQASEINTMSCLSVSKLL